MKRHISNILIAALLAVSVPAIPVLAEDLPVTVTLDGTVLELEVAPLYDTEQGRVSIPIRPFSEAVGAEVLWDAETDTATVVIGNKYMSYRLYILTMYQGQTDESTKATPIPLDTPPVLVNDRTFVPVRALMEGLGYEVNWNDTTQTVVLTTIEAPEPTATAAPTAEPTQTPEETQPPAQPEEIKNKFMASLYENLSKDKNFLVSPMALKMNFGLMASDITTKTTKEKILALLEAEDMTAYNDYAKSYNQKLSELPGQETDHQTARFGLPNLHIYRGYEEDYSPQTSSPNSELLTTAYLAKYHYNTTVLIKPITKYIEYTNEWVKDNTCYPNNFLKPFTEEVLFNSLMISAPIASASFQKPFDSNDTEKQGFTQKDGTEIELDFMQTTNVFPYFKNSRLTAVGLPLRAPFTVYLVLPEEDVNPMEFLNHREEMEDSTVKVSMPKFKINEKTELSSVVEGMGFPYLLKTKNPIGSGSSYGPAGTTDNIIQLTSLVLNENGVMDDKEAKDIDEKSNTSEPFHSDTNPVIFTADRGFTYMICDNENGEVLFLGQFANEN